MVNNLEIKEVEFNGDTLMACEKDDKIYVGVSWVCNGIGLTVDQSKRQLKNIKEDLVVTKGVSNLTLPTNGGMQEVVCIELDFLPLWLAKISITPKMQEDSPEVVEKLISYQLKAKEVLANAFTRQLPQLSWEDSMIEMLMQSKEIRLKQEAHEAQLKLQQEQLIQQQSQITTQENKVDEMVSYISDIPDFKEIERAVNTYSRRSGISPQEVRVEIYKRISDIYGINFKIRIKNAQDKIQIQREQEGKKRYSPSTLKSKVNNMTIIKEEKLEKKMIEILMAMTSELQKEEAV